MRLRATVLLGSGFLRYLATVLRLTPISLATERTLLPSSSTLCLMTCTWSILSILPPAAAPRTSPETLPDL